MFYLLMYRNRFGRQYTKGFYRQCDVNRWADDAIQRGCSNVAVWFDQSAEARQLAAHFAPGNIIFSDYWRSYDVVLEFQPTTPARSWFVRVIHCDYTGQPIKGERPRVHCTWPDKRDVITGRAELRAAA